MRLPFTNCACCSSGSVLNSSPGFLLTSLEFDAFKDDAIFQMEANNTAWQISSQITFSVSSVICRVWGNFEIEIQVRVLNLIYNRDTVNMLCRCQRELTTLPREHWVAQCNSGASVVSWQTAQVQLGKDPFKMLHFWIVSRKQENDEWPLSGLTDLQYGAHHIQNSDTVVESFPNSLLL